MLSALSNLISLPVKEFVNMYVQGGSNMTGTNCDVFTHKSSWSHLSHLVQAT
jgi:hypothetical protein